MTKRTRRNHSPAFKAKVALAAIMTAQSNVDRLITIFGGAGFLGRHVVQALAKQRTQSNR